MPTKFWHTASCDGYDNGILLHFNTGARIDNPYPTVTSITFIGGKVCKTVWQRA